MKQSIDRRKRCDLCGRLAHADEITELPRTCVDSRAPRICLYCFEEKLANLARVRDLVKGIAEKPA